MPTKAIDSSKVTMDLMLAEFTWAVSGLGNDVRFFIGDEEVEGALLVPGQPYSVYPRKFKRPVETRAVIAGPVQPPRFEVPLINIQWAVADVNRNPLCQPGNSRVPEEISLLQLFKTCIVSKHRIQGVQIMWGDHLRAGSIIETGKVSTLEEADFVEIIVDQGTLPSAPANQVEIDYVIGNERYKINVKKGMTIEKLREKLTYIHKGRNISGIASEGTQIAEEDSVEDWLQRTRGIPLEVVIPRMVQVIVDFRGGEKHFTIHETATEEEFKNLVRPFLSLNPKVRIAVTPLGLPGWEIRPGSTYWVAESRQMMITVHDTKHKKASIKVHGNYTLDQVCEAYRLKWGLPLWDHIVIARADSAPFWIENKGEYTATIRMIQIETRA
jgi:hypothetical protein